MLWDTQQVNQPTNEKLWTPSKSRKCNVFKEHVWKERSTGPIPHMKAYDLHRPPIRHMLPCLLCSLVKIGLRGVPKVGGATLTGPRVGLDIAGPWALGLCPGSRALGPGPVLRVPGPEPEPWACAQGPWALRRALGLCPGSLGSGLGPCAQASITASHHVSITSHHISITSLWRAV